ncbi:prolyl 4-hydroxylase subunit alpha-2-like [Acropora millepora]|uniref:prolyl 4-hydroxylase subunit alpha-2-like n=1 Tax=Acropora millepora TaxID=45264 RepID=UPI0010FCC54F|nr:prolyl 4-hydroxylase subunit alpha-2-like [Acropora millepora]XP_044164395.1 prolyl 4-hydroxylase subunit alpha-2-like [Acropora millepora]
MNYNIGISCLVISMSSLVSALELSPSREWDASALKKLENRLLPVLDTFISEKEDYLKELEDVLRRTSALRKMSASEVGKYLGNPLNQYFVVKRFVEDWGRLEDYMKSDNSSQDLLTQIMKEKNQIPSKDILNKSLRDLEKSKGIDPENYRVML